MELKIDVIDGKAMIFSPYSREFVKKLKGIGDSRWNSDKECWIVPEDDVSLVRRYMVECYGEDDLTTDAERFDVRVTALEYINAERAPVVLFGRPIARAFGRDSGARACDGVVLEKGEFISSGSRNRWDSAILEGTVFKVRGITQAALDLEKDNQKISVEKVERPRVDIASLKAEKIQLEARLEEINRLLAMNAYETNNLFKTAEQPLDKKK